MKKSERLTVRVTEHTKNEIEKLAKKADRSVSNYINQVLEMHVEQVSSDQHQK